MSRPRLSVVIPAFNEARRLPATLARVLRTSTRAARPPGAGGRRRLERRDRGRRARRAAAGRGTAPRAEPGQGPRGAHRDAGRRRGERRLMTDADLSTPIEELGRLEAALDRGFDVAIGSRAVAGARIEVHQPVYREAMGRLFNRLVQALLLPGLHDTQCGFKLWSAAAAAAAFARLPARRLLVRRRGALRGARRGLRIAELPVVWRNDAATRVASAAARPPSSTSCASAWPPRAAATGRVRRRAAHVAHVGARAQLADPAPRPARRAPGARAARGLLLGRLPESPAEGSASNAARTSSSLTRSCGRKRNSTYFRIAIWRPTSRRRSGAGTALAELGPRVSSSSVACCSSSASTSACGSRDGLEVHQALVDERLERIRLGETAHALHGARVREQQRPPVDDGDDALDRGDGARDRLGERERRDGEHEPAASERGRDGGGGRTERTAGRTENGNGNGQKARLRARAAKSR